eukprot:gnl/TRDRNA2_/TRDRNA2_42821_c0_seq1.p1 gnl/TRDRNA2_/TRDRNA2_42821_c0~~gnl/TRDRNA2_/TRDRNA2_42821_c0_seq1.p1  ORF type:complete len:613 (-),score=100.59 gnl/TRDRNA2_/TRDRNA2_42821_c0_seq1:77-1915(-)
MMRAIGVRILFILVAEARAREVELVDDLLDRVLAASSRRATDLDHTAMAKPVNLAMSRQSGLRPLQSYRPVSIPPAQLSFQPSGLQRPFDRHPTSLRTGSRPSFRSEASTGDALQATDSALTALRDSPFDNPRIVVLGGGFGGLYTALKLAKLEWGPKVKPSITLVDSEDRFLFKPLMYELISGEGTLDQVAPTFQDLIGNKDVHFVQKAAVDVTTVDTTGDKAGRVHFKDGGIDYDWLVLGVGATTNLDLAPGAREYAVPFGTLDDVRRLESELQKLEERAKVNGGVIDVAVVGGGAGGVELAATVAERLGSRGRVSLYVSGQELMTDFTKEAREVAKESLAAKGVAVQYNQKVREVGMMKTDDKMGPSYTLTLAAAGEAQAKDVSTDLVLWTAGAKPALGGMSFPGAQKGASVTVEPTLRIEGKEHEFAIGDVAGLGFPMTAQIAMQEADYCALNIFASIKGRPLLNFRYMHLGNLVALGSAEGSATLPIPGIGDFTVAGPIASAMRKAAYIYRMPTGGQRLKVGAEWLSKPEMWLPRGMQQDVRDMMTLNPFVIRPLVDRLREEAPDELQTMFLDLFFGRSKGEPGERLPFQGPFKGPLGSPKNAAQEP